MMKNIKATDILLLICSLILCFGTAFLFTACKMKDDSSYMTCHWAQIIVVGLGAVLSVTNLTRLFIPRSAGTGIDISNIAVAVLAALMPQMIIPMCMMHTMRCHAVMRPAVIIVSVIIILISVIDMMITVNSRGEQGKNISE